MNTIERLENAYHTKKGGLGSIPFVSSADSLWFLDVEKETEKAVLFQMCGQLHWLPKSAFFINKKYSNGKTDYFGIKRFFMEKLSRKY
ncbi:MAG: hypothetical protein KGV59_06175 [Tenacibaculum sp.]|nr:hypothetical protein [Tenacibaculum sp.]